MLSSGRSESRLRKRVRKILRQHKVVKSRVWSRPPLKRAVSFVFRVDLSLNPDTPFGRLSTRLHRKEALRAVMHAWARLKPLKPKVLLTAATAEKSRAIGSSGDRVWIARTINTVVWPVSPTLARDSCRVFICALKLRTQDIFIGITSKKFFKIFYARIFRRILSWSVSEG
jgi:hypothetical protein